MERMRYVMGTLLRLSCEGVSPACEEQALSRMFLAVQALEEKLSRFRPQSELSRLNKGELQEKELSLDTRAALEAARRMMLETDGAYLPNWRGEWDLGGSAKGFALDQALDLAQAMPEISHVRMDFGGQLLFWQREGRVNETVTIELPDQSPLIFRMDHCGSVSTSSPYERGSHIVDPATGEPILAEQSVTVIAPTALEADAWSTALFVLGPEKGVQKLAGRSDIRTVFVKNANAWASCGSLPVALAS